MDQIKEYFSGLEIEERFEKIKDYFSEYEFKLPELPHFELPQFNYKLPEFNYQLRDFRRAFSKVSDQLPASGSKSVLSKLSEQVPDFSSAFSKLSFELPSFFGSSDTEECEETDEEESMGLFWNVEEESFLNRGISLFYKTIILASVVFFAVTFYVIRSQSRKRRNKALAKKEEANKAEQSAEPRKRIILIQPKQEVKDGSSNQTVFVQELRRGIVNPEDSRDEEEHGYSYTRHVQHMTSSRVNGDAGGQKVIEPVSQLRVTHVPKVTEFTHHENAPISSERHHESRYKYTATIEKSKDSEFSLTALNRQELGGEARKSDFSTLSSLTKTAHEEPKPLETADYHTESTTTAYEPQHAVVRSFVRGQPEYAEHHAAPARRPLYPEGTPEPQRRAESLQPFGAYSEYSRESRYGGDLSSSFGTHRPRDQSADQNSRSYSRHETIEKTEKENPSGSISFRSFVRDFDKTPTPPRAGGDGAKTSTIFQQDVLHGAKAFLHGSSPTVKTQHREAHREQKSDVSSTKRTTSYREFSRTPTPPRSKGDEDKTIIFQQEVRQGSKAFVRQTSPGAGTSQDGPGPQKIQIEVHPRDDLLPKRIPPPLPPQPAGQSYSTHSKTHRSEPTKTEFSQASRREFHQESHSVQNGLDHGRNTHHRLVIHEPEVPPPVVNLSPQGSSGYSYSATTSNTGGLWSGGDFYTRNIPPSYESSPFDNYGQDRGYARGIVGSAIQKKRQLEPRSPFKTVYNAPSGHLDDERFTRAITDIRYATERLG